MSGKIAYVLLLSSFISLSAKEASAQGAGEYWHDTATGLCLDSNDSGDAYTHGCGGDFQQWARVAVGNNIVFQDLKTGRCLDSDHVGKAYTLPCNYGRFQNWTMVDTGGYHYEFKNAATGLCLDSNFQGKLYTLTCNGGNFQRWYVR